MARPALPHPTRLPDSGLAILFILALSNLLYREGTVLRHCTSRWIASKYPRLRRPKVKPSLICAPLHSITAICSSQKACMQAFASPVFSVRTAPANTAASVWWCIWCSTGAATRIFSQKIFACWACPTMALLPNRSKPRSNVFPMPEHLDWEQAAALPLAGLTAWRTLFSRCKLKKAEKVLITGIGGGVALTALQLAVAAGAEVFVTSSSDEKIEKAMELGAKGAPTTAWKAGTKS